MRIINWLSYQELEDEYDYNDEIKCIRYTSAVIMLNVLWKLKDKGLRLFVRPVKDYEFSQVEYSSTMFRKFLKKGTDTNAKKLLEDTGFFEIASGVRFNSGVYNRGQILGIKKCKDELFDISKTRLNQKKVDQYDYWLDNTKKHPSSYKVGEKTLNEFKNMILLLRLEGKYAYYNPKVNLTYRDYENFCRYFNSCLKLMTAQGRKLNFSSRFILKSLEDYKNPHFREE